MKIALFPCASIALLSAISPAAIVQSSAKNLPEAPTMAMISPLSPMSSASFLRRTPEPIETPARKVVHWYKKSDNQVALVLAAAEVMDGIGTHENMTHKQWLCGYDPNLGNVSYRVNGSTYADNAASGVSILAATCGPAPVGTNENYAVNVTTIFDSFEEGGWAARFVNNRNYPGVELLNIGLDGAGLAVGSMIPNRGKMRWIKAAVTAVNFAHAGGHFYEGYGNFQYVHSPKQSANLFFESRPYAAFNVTIFPGPRWWGIR